MAAITRKPLITVNFHSAPLFNFTGQQDIDSHYLINAPAVGKKISHEEQRGGDEGAADDHPDTTFQKPTPSKSPAHHEHDGDDSETRENQ